MNKFVLEFLSECRIDENVSNDGQGDHEQLEEVGAHDEQGQRFQTPAWIRPLEACLKKLGKVKQEVK